MKTMWDRELSAFMACSATTRLGNPPIDKSHQDEDGQQIGSFVRLIPFQKFRHVLALESSSSAICLIIKTVAGNLGSPVTPREDTSVVGAK